MKRQKRFLGFFCGIIFVILAVLIITKPEICKNSAISGILLCGRVIIPSLFTFTVCVLFIMKCGITDLFCGLDFFTKKLFGLSAELTLLAFLSFIGGYPVGAKLLNDAVEKGRISAKDAGKMLNYCINAGPGFIVAAVGNAILGSKVLGYFLLASHLTASLIMMLFLRPEGDYNSKSSPRDSFNFSDSFVASVTDSSSATMEICGYVILFSVITAYAEYLTRHSAYLKYINLGLEVTTAIPKAENIFVVSFLLGFSGLSVWCQIFSTAKSIKINFAEFALCRIIHGILSCGITAILLKIFPVTVSCISNGSDFSGKAFYSTPALSAALIIMGFFFLVSVFNKKHTGKLINDVV